MPTKPVNRWLVLFTVMMAFLPIVVDMTVLHIAIPSLTLALGATGSEVLWIIDIYPLVMASLLIPMGTLADRVGHRRLLLVGMSIFTLGSLLGAFSPNPGFLIGARALMAVGSAMVMPCTLALIRQSFENGKERALALGLWSAFAAAGAAFGPLIGGALLAYFWWGSVFLVNVPIMLTVVPLVVVSIHRTTVGELRGWTVKEALVLMAGVMAIVYGIKSGFKPGTGPVLGLGIAASGLVLLAIFVRNQRASPVPMFDMSLFSKPAIRTGVIMALVTMGALAGVELTVAQELQFVHGHSPLQAGVFMTPLMFGAAIGEPFAGMALSHIGLRPVAVASLAVSAACLLGMAFSSFQELSPVLAVVMGLLGIALNIGLTTSSVAIMNSTPAEKAGAAGALEASSYDLGTGLGITVFGVTITSIYTRALQWPASVPAHEEARHSIGETMSLASRLDSPARKLLEEAGRTAFSSAHSLVMTAAAALIALLAVVVFVQLRGESGHGA